MQITPLGEPHRVRLVAASVRGAEPSPQLTTTEPPAGGKVGDGRALVGVGEGAEQHGARVEIPSIPVISVPLELVSGASRTVTPPPGAGQRGGHAAEGRDDDAERVGSARGRLLGVGVAAEDLEDRVARIGWGRQRRDADLLDHERDARGGRRAVAPAADGERRVDVGDGRQRVGVGERRQHELAGVLALDRGEVPGRRRSPADR